MKQHRNEEELKSVKVESHKFSISIFGIYNFIAPQQLISLVTGYQHRGPNKWTEINQLGELGGHEKLCESLNVNPNKGLTGEDDRHRRSIFGSNERAPAKTRSFWKIVWDAAGDTLIRILFFCGLISIAINMATEENKSLGILNNNLEKKIAWIDGMGIMVSVIIVVFVSAINDWQKERQFKALNKTAEQTKIV